MAHSVQTRESAPAAAALSDDSAKQLEEYQLTSGRRLYITRSSDQSQPQEEVRIQSSTGDIELHITLTPQGPRLRLSGAQLELVSDNDINVHCRRFKLRAADDLTLATGGEVAIRAERDCRINGQKLFFNCDEDFAGESPSHRESSVD